MTTAKTKTAVKKTVRKPAAARISEIHCRVYDELKAQVDELINPFLAFAGTCRSEVDRLHSLRDDAYMAISEELRQAEATGTPKVLEQRFRDAGQIVLDTLRSELTVVEAEAVNQPTMLFGQPIRAHRISDASPTLAGNGELPVNEAAAAVAAAAGAPVRLKKELPPLKLRARTQPDELFTDPSGGLPPAASESVDMEFGEVQVRARGDLDRPWLRDRLANGVARMRSWVSGTASDHRIRFVKHVAAIQNGVLGRVVVSLTDTGLLIVQTGVWVVTVAVSLTTYSLLAAVVVLIEDLARLCQLTAQNVILMLSRRGQPKLA